MLELLIEDTARNLDLPSAKIEQLSELLMMLVFDHRHGGFSGFSASFQRLGMQDKFASWSSTTKPNQPIEFDQVKEIFGVPLIAAMGGKLGIGSVMTTRALCCLLPGLIEELTLAGDVPSTIPDSLRSRCIGTFEWLHEIDSAGWVVWRDQELMTLREADSAQPERIFSDGKLNEMPWLMGALSFLLIGILLRV